MKRQVLMYGLIGGLLITVLKWTEYRFLVIEHSIEVYGALVAALLRDWASGSGRHSPERSRR